MAWPPSVSTTEAWTRADGVGAWHRSEFSGADGLRRLDGPQVVTAVPAAAFRSGLVRVQLVGCALECYCATGHRIDRAEAQIAAYPVQLLTLVVVRQGLVRVRTEQRAFDVPAGGAALLDSRTPVSCHVPDDVELVRCVARIAALPLAAGRLDRPLNAPVPPSSLLSGTSRILVRALDARTADGPADPGLLGRALLHLHAAVVDEVLETSDPR